MIVEGKRSRASTLCLAESPSPFTASSLCGLEQVVSWVYPSFSTYIKMTQAVLLVRVHCILFLLQHGPELLCSNENLQGVSREMTTTSVCTDVVDMYLQS